MVRRFKMSGYAFALLLVGIFGFALLVMAILHKPHSTKNRTIT
ncbi:hypothetical protein MNB_SUP05-SYMBIONT-5-1269 [hydrothermal vent metagenome]|uniref:Uncharacterized protein n=1 Tax=hydrothermal vent metagenome TaxID=652676 RepID=A0A1W1E2G9_9ZZZZ